MAPIYRTLLLKKVVQIEGERYPVIPELKLHESMTAVFNAAETVWDRHYPPKHLVKPGKRCIFLERVERQGAAVLFHAYSYLAGHTPDQVVFDDVRARVTADPILDEGGSHREIVERFAVIVLGEAIVIETARVAGSSQMAIKAIRDLIRRHVAPRHPNLKLEDAPGLNFKRLVRLHKGVSSVTARLHQEFTAEPGTFGEAMESIVTSKGFPGSKVVTKIEAPQNGELDADKVEDMLAESEAGTGLSSITIHFNSGSVLGELDKYREKISVPVQQVRPGVPAVTEIEAALVDYLRTLTQPSDDNFQLINSQGKFT